jgi:hypothetical protein
MKQLKRLAHWPRDHRVQRVRLRSSLCRKPHIIHELTVAGFVFYLEKSLASAALPMYGLEIIARRRF